jgi:hypothetical protein
MGEAKRRQKQDPYFGDYQQAILNGPFWVFKSADDHLVENLTLDNALNLLGYYTVEQAKIAIPNMMPWDKAKMKINDRIYQSVKKLCLKDKILWDGPTNRCIEISCKGSKQLKYWVCKKTKYLCEFT